jgi:hypothetical protein
MYNEGQYNGYYYGNGYEANPYQNRRYQSEGSVSAGQAKQFVNQLVDMQLNNGQLICNARVVSVADTGAMRYAVCRKNIPYIIEGHTDNIVQISPPGGLCGK